MFKLFKLGSRFMHAALGTRSWRQESDLHTPGRPCTRDGGVEEIYRPVYEGIRTHFRGPVHGHFFSTFTLYASPCMRLKHRLHLQIPTQLLRGTTPSP